MPNGSLGFRFGEEGKGRWNLDLGDVDPLLSVYGTDGAETVTVDLPRFGTPAVRVRCCVAASRPDGWTST